MPTPHYQLVLTTCPDAKVARRLAQALVSEGLAACVNILPVELSVYRWQGRIESARERLLVIKSERRAYAAIEKRLRALHPYELPEIIAVPIVAGLRAYLGWLSRPDAPPQETRK
jgi:periplasmic divalent cation tolerance protein